MFHLVFPNVFFNLFFTLNRSLSPKTRMMRKTRRKLLVLVSLLRSIKNEFVDNNNDVDDVSSFGLGDNDSKEFGDVSKRWITC
jgi:hypothetical protein